MKQWKLLVDCPWGKEGKIIPYYSFGMITMCDEIAIRAQDTADILFRPQDYPSIFQLVPEKTDEDKLERWLYQNAQNCWGDDVAYNNIMQPNLNRIAKALIEKGFDVEKIKGEI